MNLITQTIEIVGLGTLAARLGVSYQAVRKWERAQCLPRTEHTGETRYAEIIETLTAGKVTREALLRMTSQARVRRAGNGARRAVAP
jgi:DNA-binding transcriptional regulator YdaS (Cro superfamily)